VDLGVIDWGDASLPVLSEAECGEWYKARGRRVVEHRGRLWVESRRYFFQPVHHLAKLSAHEATRPARSCLGFRARLAEDAWEWANGSLPAHTFPDPQSYDLGRLRQTPRRQVRQGLRAVDVVALEIPDLILDQGYAVAAEAHARDNGIDLPGPATFRKNILSFFSPRRGLILAAVRDQHLLGFSLTSAVDAAAYHDMVYVTAQGLANKVPVCLFHAFATLVSRRPQVQELMHGVHVRDDEGLCEFKRRIGLVVTPLPARAWFAGGLDGLLRRARPQKYYQVTGRG
jgi:hypothetical protein